MAFEVTYGLSHVEPLYPHNIFLVGGVLKHIELPPLLTVLYVDLLLFLMSVVIISTALLFVFRYSQTVDGWLCETMSKSRRIVPAIFLLLAVVIGTITVPIHATISTHEDIVKRFVNNTEFLSVIDNRNVFSFKVGKRSTLFAQ